MSWGAVIAGAAALIGGAMSSNAAGDAADAAGNASDAATAEQRRQFDLTRQDMEPWMQAGGWALDQQRNFLAGNYGAALNSPWYRAAQVEGLKSLQAGATANGNLWGGGADADRIAFGQNLASQNLTQHYNALAGMSQTGQVTANQLGAYGQNYANAVGQNAWNLAGAQGQSAYNQAGAWNNALGGMVGAWGYHQGRQGG